MMNLNMNRKWKRGMVVATTLFCLTSPFSSVLTYASEQVSPIVSIEKPEGWKQGSVDLVITIDDSQMEEGFTIAKIEAKVGNGSWQDVTESKKISVTTNETIYVRVTDGKGTVYEQNRSIQCFDTEKPTLSASLTDGVLTIQGNDTLSGISTITVNGTAYSELKDGRLKVQLTQKDFKTKKIEMTATDGAGNTSEKYMLQNPYYEWAKKQAQPQVQTGAMTPTTPVVSQTAEQKSTAPLPQSAKPSEPTNAKGNVTEKTNVQDSKAFYTIETKSGKTFYLIVDNEKQQDNVYFLTEASDQDLLNFTLSDTVTLPDVGTVYAEPEIPQEESQRTPTEEKPKEEKEEALMPEDQSPIGSYLLIGLLVVGVAGAGYYFKVYKPKHEYDEEDEYEEDDEKESEYEEEREVEEEENEDKEESAIEIITLEDEEETDEEV